MKVKVQLSLLFALLVLFAACDTPRGFQKMTQSVSLAPYTGSKSFQVTLVDRVSVDFAPTFYVTDSLYTNRNSAIPLIIYNRWDRDFIHFMYLNKDSSAITDNLRQHLLNDFSKLKSTPSIDALRVTINTVEMIVPYRNRGYFIPLVSWLFLNVVEERSIGPSRVRLQVTYECFHNQRKISNTKNIQSTTSTAYTSTSTSQGTINTEEHVETAFIVLNELLERMSMEIYQEVEEVIDG